MILDMTHDGRPDLEKAYDVALATRNLEIDLFWKRAFFFWAFVAAAFAGFGSMYEKSAGLALIVAGFGAVCSAAWSFLNRGSKYWQQTWEARVEELEDAVTGPLFKVDAPVQRNTIAWLQARRFSVSKLTIALSDFIAVLWLLLAAGQVARILEWQPALEPYARTGAIAFLICVVAYIAALARYCRTSLRGSMESTRQPGSPR